MIGGGGASPSSSNSGGQFLLQLLQKPQPQPQPRPNPHQDPAVAAMGPSLPFQSNGHDHSPQPWVNQPCLPHEFFPPPPSPWPIPVPHPSSSQFPVFPEDFQRLGLLGNGKPPTLHHRHHHNSNRRSLDGPEIGFTSSQNHPEFDRRLNSRSTSHYAPHELIRGAGTGAPHELIRGAGTGEGWGRKEELVQPVKPVHHAPPPGFHHKHKGLQHNVDRELGSWDHSPNNNDHMLRNHGNGSSRSGLTRQLDHPGPPMGSKLHSVPASHIEESLANLQRQAVEQEIKHRTERQGNWNMGGRPGQDDLADKFMETVVFRDRFEKKNGVTNYKDFHDKDFTSKEFRELSAPGQRMRNHRRVVGCRTDLDRMNAPFLTIYESLVPSEEEKTKQKQLLTLLEKLVNKEWPKAELYLYGSCASSFGVSNSDIDVCLSIKDLDISKSELLLKLADILQSDNLENVQALTRARVPIVKLMDPATGISCDICINNVLAVVNTKLLRDYAQIDGRLRQLAFIVKHWAKSRGVNVTYQGTLSSYAYVLMCIHFLQQRKPAILPCLQGMEATYVVTVDDIECAYFDQVENLRNFGAQNKESIVELVWAFFDYWAFRHDYANAVISVRTGSIISKREKDWTRRIGNDRHLICIEDPFEISHDLGRVVDKYSIKILREEFERAANIMQYDPDPCATLFEPYVP